MKRSARNAYQLGLGLVLLCLVGSRIYYRFVLGGRFDVTPLHRYIQFVDYEILSDSLFESIWYLHDQAPLLNLLNGLAIRLSPDHYEAPLELMFFGFSVVLAVSLFGSMRRLGVPPAVATIATAVFVASPAVYLYESWLLYHQPTAAFLSLSVLLCLRFGDRPTLGRGVAFFGCLATVVLFRNLYGLVWYAVLFLGFLIMRLAPMRRLYLSALPGALLLVLFALKQQIVFGTPSTGDAFVGPNLMVRAQGSYGKEELLRLAKEGGAPAVLGVPPLSSIEDYRNVVRLPPPTGVRALDRAETSSGRVNLHNIAYLPIGRAYQRAAIGFFRERPYLYWSSVWRAWDYGYFRPTSTDPQLQATPAHRAIWPVLEGFENFLGHEERYNSRSVIAVYALAMLYVGARLFRRLWRHRIDPPRDAALWLMLVTIVYASLATTLISFGDYQRYRYALDPLFWICISVLFHALLRFFGGLVMGRAIPENG